MNEEDKFKKIIDFVEQIAKQYSNKSPSSGYPKPPPTPMPGPGRPYGGSVRKNPPKGDSEKEPSLTPNLNAISGAYIDAKNYVSFPNAPTEKPPPTQGPDDARHFSAGKPPLADIPPEAEFEVAKVIGFGAEKYGNQNWRKGGDWVEYIGSARRHIAYWLMREDLDPQSNLNHLAHAIVNLMFVMTWQIIGIGRDSRAPRPK